MSKASNFVKERNEALKTRPKIELEVPNKDQKCLFRVGRTGNLEFHYSSIFSVLGEEQGETYSQAEWEPEAALKLAEWVIRTFK